jgi:cytosine/adenosine deaminase-related metal-dependent hydrolase
MRATLYSADWLAPVSAPPIRQGAVLVDETGVIRAVGPAVALEVGDDVVRIDLGAAVLMPGLIDVHAHAELAALRGMLEDLPFHAWIPALRRAKRGADPADFAAAARWTCIEALSAGVTTLAVTEDSGAALDALRESGMRGIVFREVFGPDPTQAREALAALVQKVDSMQRSATDLVRVGVSPHAPYTVSDDLYRLVASYAGAERLPIAVHIAESEVEAQLVVDGAGPFAAGLRTRGIATPARAASPIALLAATGVLALKPLLIHCVRVGRDDVQRIAASGASVAHCPVANARLGHGVAPIVELAAAGVTIGIGSDSVASNNRIDLLEEARIAQLMQRAQALSSGALPPPTLLRMLTVDGARALGIDAHTGSLDVGKDADLCAVSLAGVHTQPVNDPVATLLLSACGADVMLTVVRGHVLYRNGECLTLDTEPLRAQLEQSAARMRTARDEA